ncbi:MAG: YdcF family protein [Candidatus Micrarchaeota archaeon]|nr:YdcF family protein [Candidatus Micrarchaeota archaeon]
MVKKKKVDVVVLCGGLTNIKFPEKSEAGTMSDYLKPLLGEHVKIILEEKSRTTPENIQFSKEFIDLSSENKIFVTTDSVRYFKVYWEVLHYWFGLSKEEISADWLNATKQIYSNPKKKEIDIQIKDLKKYLVYKNVKIVIDNFHKSYKNAVQQLAASAIEIEGLYDQKVMENLLEQMRVKEEGRAKFGWK